MRVSSWPQPAWLLVPLPDAFVGAALAVTGVVDSAGSSAFVHPWTELFAAAAMAPVVLRTRAPLVMALVSAAGFVGYAVLPGTGTPLWSFLGILVIAFSIGAHLRGRRQLLAGCTLVVSVYVVQVLDAARMPGQLSWAEVYLTPPLLVLAPALAGGLLQRSREQTERLRVLAARLDAERQLHAEAAAVAERHRIARELHDVISHSVSVMVVQAGAAEQLLPAGSPALDPVREVRRTGKQALAELRRQLGVLGARDEVGPAPLPGLEDLTGLVRASGAALQVEGAEGAPLPPGLQLAVFRVVQEALTNAARHAHGSPVDVRVAVHGDGVEVEVVDRGGAPDGHTGSGVGLAGMRERIGLYGGVLDAGPRGSGWCVHAWLPVPAPAAPAPAPAHGVGG